MNKSEMIKNAIAYNAMALGIHEPPFCFRSGKHFATPTSPAQLHNGVIEINTNAKQDALWLWFTVSHEMRHLWQVETNYGDLNAQKPSESGRASDYNRQPLEIDAMAWAHIVMAKVFGIRPTLETALDADVIEAIHKRIIEIKEE